MSLNQELARVYVLRGDDGDYVKFMPTEVCGRPLLLVGDPALPNLSVVTDVNGDGFFSLNLPDGTPVGGDCRGKFTIDLQMARSSESQIAQAIGSSLFSGVSNRVEDPFRDSTVVGGALLTMSGETDEVTSTYNGMLAGYGNYMAAIGSVALNNNTIVGGQSSWIVAYSNSPGNSSDTGVVSNNFNGGGLVNLIVSGWMDPSTRQIQQSVHPTDISNSAILGGAGNNIYNNATTETNDDDLDDSVILGGRSCTIYRGIRSVIAGGQSNWVGGPPTANPTVNPPAVVSNAFIGGGNGLIAENNNSATFGHFNIPNAVVSGSPVLFTVGDGTNNGTRANAFAVSQGGYAYHGSAYADKSHTSAITAMYESHDGRTIAAGIQVVVSQGKIRQAVQGDQGNRYLVVSRPGAIVINDVSEWPQKYLLNEAGEFIYDEEEYTEQTPLLQSLLHETKAIVDGKLVTQSVKTDSPVTRVIDGVKIPVFETKVKTRMVRRLNPRYNSELKYIRRSQRPEWHYVSLVEV